MNKTNAEAKSEAKTQANSEANTQAKLESEPESEAKLEAKLEANSETKSEANSEPEESEPESETKSEANSESKSADKETKANSWHGHLNTKPTETKTEPKIKPTELDWLFNLIDSIQKGTFNPIKWPEFFKLPTPPQIVLIEMLELAKQYAAVKVKMKEFEYEQQLNQSKNE